MKWSPISLGLQWNGISRNTALYMYMHRTAWAGGKIAFEEFWQFFNLGKFGERGRDGSTFNLFCKLCIRHQDS